MGTFYRNEKQRKVGFNEMAQLPPRIPNIGMNWPANVHQRFSCEDAQPSWIDEFLDFSSARRGCHRRSLSDSIAFFEAPVIDESRNSIGSSGEFEKLDEDQLNSMFSDEICGVPSNPSTSSDHNSNNEEKPTASEQKIKNENEVQSSCKSEQQLLVTPPKSINGEPIVDPKRVKRILANRQSAQRSRVRKLQYISELERSVTSLQTEVSALSPRVAFLDHQRLVLNVDNSALKQRIAALAQDKIFKDAHQEALKKEIERLTRVYEQQNLKKSTTATAIAGAVVVSGEELRI